MLYAVHCIYTCILYMLNGICVYLRACRHGTQNARNLFYLCAVQFLRPLFSATWKKTNNALLTAPQATKIGNVMLEI